MQPWSNLVEPFGTVTVRAKKPRVFPRPALFLFAQPIYHLGVNRSVTVAVVDGNSGTRQGLIRRLQQISWIATSSDTGDPDEALKIARERRPDVVLMDIRGMDRDGTELLSQMAAAAPQTRIIVLTAYVTEQERSELMRAGAQAILLKEIGSDRLIQTIRTLAAQPASGGD